MTLIDQTEALEPCPFCGGEAETITGPIPRKWGVRCINCDVWRDDRCDSEGDAIASWNRRAALPARGVGVKPPPLHVTNSMSTSTAPPQDGWHLSFGKGGFPSVMHVSGGTAFCYHDLIEGLQAWASAALAPTDAVRCAECDCDDGNCTWIKMHIESDAPTDAAQAREAALQQPIKRTGK